MKNLILSSVFALIASSAAQAQQAVQWKVSDGGNGHWYLGVQAPGTTWADAAEQCIAMSASLACINTVPEHEFIVSRVLLPQPELFQGVGGWGPHIGGIQAPGSTEPIGGWSWIDGQPIDCSTGFCLMENCCGGQDRLTYARNGTQSFVFNDVGEAETNNVPGYLVEWSADCNADGVVDYGQIVAGELIDLDMNLTPDCCEGPSLCSRCPGDVTKGGTVDATDLSVVLAAWGTIGQGEFQADIDRSGLVDGGDLALVLGGWGPCPQ